MQFYDLKSDLRMQALKYDQEKNEHRNSTHLITVNAIILDRFLI